jgi:hypothetical protein
MESLELKFAELHSPLFLAGCNLSVKLDPARRVGLELNYIRKFGELHVKWNGETAMVPVTNIVSMVAGSPKFKADPNVSHPMVMGSSATAQVETPYGHVHAGPGKGKTK